jgi:hypothetical protein
MMAVDWEANVASLLNDLSSVQSSLLETLRRKRDLLVKGDTAGMAQLQLDEEQLLVRLQACHDRRAGMLEEAASEGLPSDSIRSLTGSLPRAKRDNLGKQVHQASLNSRLLEHHSLTNWVLVQRSLIHLSQMLEIIATGGRPKPTYGTGESAHNSGSLVDQAA